MTRPVPVLLCFDVEPDEIEVGVDATPWLGFEHLPSLMRPVEEKLTALLTSPLAERLIFTTPDAIVGDDASMSA